MEAVGGSPIAEAPDPDKSPWLASISLGQRNFCTGGWCWLSCGRSRPERRGNGPHGHPGRLPPISATDGLVVIRLSRRPVADLQQGLSGRLAG
jgi:hypothetical protein